MQPEEIRCGRPARDRWAGLALAGWTVVLVVICLRAALSPGSHSCYPIFAKAARNWQTGTDLYSPEQQRQAGLDCYRYSPLIAALLTGLSFFPDWLGGVLWRLVNAGVLLGGLAWWCRAGLLPSWRSSQRGLLFLLVLPLAAGSLNNAQANPLVLGLVLATLAAATEKRWHLASACMALACLFKIYPIAVGLLLAALYPRAFTGRLLLALAVGLVLPFLLQKPEYVAGQYQSWMEQVGADDRTAFPPEYCYRDLQLLSRVWVTPMSPRVYQMLQLLAGAAMAALCLAARRSGWPQQRLLTYLLGLGSCWMTLFGPATESCTYILVAPALAWALLEANDQGRPVWIRGGLAGAYTLLVTAALACWFPGGRSVQALGLQPLGAVLLFLYLLFVEKKNGSRYSETQYRLSRLPGRGSVAPFPPGADPGLATAGGRL